MGCGCAERARIVLRKMGYTLNPDGVWRHPAGHTIVDVELEEHHGKLTVAALWVKFTAKGTS